MGETCFFRQQKTTVIAAMYDIVYFERCFFKICHECPYDSHSLNGIFKWILVLVCLLGLLPLNITKHYKYIVNHNALCPDIFGVMMIDASEIPEEWWPWVLVYEVPDFFN